MGVCSCTYPRCFAGELVSKYSITDAKGEGLKLKGLVSTEAEGKDRSSGLNIGGIFPALEKKLKGCCENKTQAYIAYAQKQCGEEQLGKVCSKTPNGYEPR